MRTVYLLIVVFVLWCVVSSGWYLFWVKGLSTQPINIDPHQSALAITEILLIILISTLIGFGIAWYLRNQVIQEQQEKSLEQTSEIRSLETSMKAVSDENQKLETTLSRARATFKDDFTTISRDNERLKSEIDELSQQYTLAQGTLVGTTEDLRGSQEEVRALQSRMQKLESDLEACIKVKNEYRKPAPAKPTTESKDPLADNGVDDLKEINGIGPGIQKKLNQIGIYNFRQLSELSPANIKEITEAIMFFPGRIERDRWVEQASTLYLKKIRGDHH